jgi:tRNA wybutosine-synthesizing protein 3
MAASLLSDAAVIPPGFVARKSKILSDLSVPDAEYTDLSPKGSVDEGIRDLIRDINALDGLVTTSSCAGRASVFVEGRKKSNRKQKTQPFEAPTVTVTSSVGNSTSGSSSSAVVDQDAEGRKFALAGGKGEGRWLYVSHDPVNLAASYHELFGLVPGDGVPSPSISQDGSIRLIRFHYDPMVRTHTLQFPLHKMQWRD